MFFPVHRWAVEEQSEVVQEVAADDANLGIRQEISPPEIPPHEGQAGVDGFGLADRAVEPHDLTAFTGPLEPEGRDRGPW